jgi:hypothetical protein
VEKTSSKTMVIIDPKTKAKKAHVYKFLEWARHKSCNNRHTLHL